MRVINIIPVDYSGDPREALGYAWAELVMDGYKVNPEKSTPGEDILGGHEQIQNLMQQLKNEFGDIVAINQQDSEFREQAGEKIAVINCMWCGGATMTIYKKVEAQAVTQVKTETEAERPDPLVNVKGDRKKKEAVYDNLFNEGEEGYNPYRD